MPQLQQLEAYGSFVKAFYKKRFETRAFKFLDKTHRASGNTLRRTFRRTNELCLGRTCLGCSSSKHTVRSSKHPTKNDLKRVRLSAATKHIDPQVTLSDELSVPWTNFAQDVHASVVVVRNIRFVRQSILQKRFETRALKCSNKHIDPQETLSDELSAPQTNFAQDVHASVVVVRNIRYARQSILQKTI